MTGLSGLENHHFQVYLVDYPVINHFFLENDSVEILISKNLFNPFP